MSTKTDHRGNLPAALASGALQAVLFNPYDRALFLRVHHDRPFLHADNFRHPFQGFANAAVYRTLSGGAYYYFQESYKEALESSRFSQAVEDHPVLAHTIVGFASGASTAALLNPMQLVKYHMWAGFHPDRRPTFLGETKRLWQAAGIRIYSRGVGISVLRDVTFGVVYEVCRTPRAGHSPTERERFLLNTASATAASVVSSPFNYCRNLVFAAPALGCPLSTRHLLVFLAKNTILDSTAPWYQRLMTLQGRLNVGWGSLRVGIGMAVGQWTFAYAKQKVISWEDGHRDVVAHPTAAMTPSSASSFPPRIGVTAGAASHLPQPPISAAAAVKSVVRH